MLQLNEELLQLYLPKEKMDDFPVEINGICNKNLWLIRIFESE